MKFERVASLLGPLPLPETTGSISLVLEVLFLNSAVDAQGDSFCDSGREVAP